MSRELGRIQRECLRVIEDASKPLTTYRIVAKVYQVKPDRRGKLMISEAQHVAVKRALGGLRRKGLILGQQALSVARDGRTILALSQGTQWPLNGRAERCCFWSLVNRNEATLEAPPATA